MNDTYALASMRTGRYLVPTRSTVFGLVVEHGIESDPVIFIARMRLSGLRPFDVGVKLKHQTYVDTIDRWLDGRPDTDVVSVVSLSTAEWADVWVRDGCKVHLSAWQNRP